MDERIRFASKIVSPTVDANEAEVDAAGNLQVILGANDGVDIGDVDVTSVIPGVGVTNLGKAEDQAFAGGDVGVASMVIQDAVLGALSSADDDYTNLRVDATGALWIILSAPLPTGTNEIGDIRAITTSVTPGAGPTFLGKAEDVASAAADVGVAAMVVQDAVLSALASVDGDYTFLRVDANGALHVTDPNAGVSHVDDAIFVTGTDTGVPIFGIFDDVGINALEENDAGVIRCSSNRNLYETIRDAAGNERGANVTAANELNVLATAQPGVDIGDVDVLSVIPGVGATNLGKAIDDVVGGTDTGVAMLVERVDTPSAITPANGDYTTPIVDANGRLHVTDPNAGAGTPSNPVVDTPALANIAGGVVSTGTELRTADLGGTTRQLTGIEISSSAPFKATIIQEDDDAETIKVRALFGRAGEPLQWRPPNKAYFNVAFGSNAGFDGWRVEMTNLDNSQTTDFYVTFYYED